MNKGISFVAKACLLVLITSPVLAETPATYALRNDPARSEEFMDWGMGMFIHWSFDSELGSVISHSMVGASDDYLDRYINELPTYFNPENYDPEKWVKLAKLAGFKYMVLTTKHHNGFCMWPTKTTDFSIENTPYGKDIVKPFVEACRKHGMKVGFYFSPEDFWFLHQQGHDIRRRGQDYAHVTKNQALQDYSKSQLKELLTEYGAVDVVFLDGKENGPMREYVHELQPLCIVTRGEMETPEQRIPDHPIEGPWESCFTLGTQWQFKPTHEEYKSGTTLIEMLIDIRAKGGNLLINMGPEPSGNIPFEQERRFRELALWMFVNREAIHEIRPCSIIKEDDIRFTRSSSDPDTVYAFIPQGQKMWERGVRREYVFKSLAALDATRISVLGQNDRVVEYKPQVNPESRFEQTDEGLKISIVRAQRLYNNHEWPNPVVVKLKGVRVEGPASD
ncbi:alpha-L-fucosidase [Pontiellaceae bacterium B12227]|nr:alpha-L-fucosidase [Pontiellaceae bacterium B12227]